METRETDFSENELIAYVFNHLPLERRQAIDRARRADAALRQRLAEFEALSQDTVSQPLTLQERARALLQRKGLLALAAVLLLVGSGAALPPVRKALLTLVIPQADGQIRLEVPIDNQTQLQLDGQLINNPHLLAGGLLNVKPGSHEIVLLHQGKVIMRQQVIAVAGDHVPVRYQAAGEALNPKHGVALQFEQELQPGEPPHELRSLLFTGADELLVASGKYDEPGTLFRIDLASQQSTALTRQPHGIPSVAQNGEQIAWTHWQANQLTVRSEAIDQNLPLTSTSRIALAKDTLVAAGEDGMVRVWNADQLQPAGEWQVDTILHTVALSPNGETIVGAGGHYAAWGQASSVGRIFVWSGQGKLLHELPGHTATVLGIAISPDGSTLASAGVDQSVKFWDLRTGQLRRSILAHENIIECVAFSPDGSLVASGSWDTRVLVWHVATGDLIATLQRHTSHVKSLAFSPQGNRLASCGTDGRVQTWSITAPRGK